MVCFFVKLIGDFVIIRLNMLLVRMGVVEVFVGVLIVWVIVCIVCDDSFSSIFFVVSFLMKWWWELRGDDEFDIGWIILKWGYGVDDKYGW